MLSSVPPALCDVALRENVAAELDRKQWEKDTDGVLQLRIWVILRRRFRGKRLRDKKRSRGREKRKKGRLMEER